MASDNVRIMCPNLSCRRVLAVPGSARGKLVRCRNCSTNIKVPQPKAAASALPLEAGPDGKASK
ncbi:hypothetical protein BH11PLA1_BH11PLA1_04580 [soil metagenome]